MTLPATPIALLADIGGTQARFALCHADDTLSDVRVLSADTLPPGITDVAALCRHYLRGVPDDCRIDRAAWAVAGPVTGDSVTITNRGWRFSRDALQAEFGWEAFHLVNDFAALAMALPHLTDADKILIKPARDADGQPLNETPRAPLCAIGPGTGLGVAGLIPLSEKRGQGGWQVVPTEGGHVALPACNAAEHAILSALQARFGHVAAEHVLSGRGLVHLCQAMFPESTWTTPQEIAAAALGRKTWDQPEAGTAPPDLQARAVLDQFCAFLGTVAGDAALTLGARGGVFLAGGILPQLVPVLQASVFGARFIEKYAVRAYLDAVPVWLITHPLPALIGLTSLLKADA